MDGGLGGAQTVFCRHDLIHAVSGLVFNYRMVHCSERCKLFLLDALFRIIHSPVTGSKIYKPPRNGSRIATAGKEVGGNGNFLNL